MKILLINPITQDTGINVLLPNLGLAYLAASLKSEKFEVEILDGCKEGVDEKIVRDRLSKADYDAVGFQIFTMILNKTKEYLNLVKSFNKKIITIVGGPHPSVDRENILNYLPSADFAIVGEGEESLPQLLKILSKNTDDFSDIPNLIWRNENKIVLNPLKYIEDLDKYGIPCWDLISPLEYPQAPMGAFIKSFPYAPIMVTRGCPYNCTFCTAGLIMGKRIRTRSIKNVIEEIKMLIEKYKIKEILIIDDNFTLKREVVKNFCEEIISQNIKLNISFPSGLKLNTLDKEIVCLLEKAGCYSLALGIESGSDRILKHMKKKQTVEKIKEKVGIITENTKIRVTGYFLIGYPEETQEDILKTIKLAKELNLARAQFAFCLPLPGSQIYKELKEKNKIKEINYDSIRLHNLSYRPYKISSFRLKLLRLYAYFTFYLRPKIILGILKEIKSFQHLRFILRKVKMLFK